MTTKDKGNMAKKDTQMVMFGHLSHHREHVIPALTLSKHDLL
ncbi:hypothetical protein [Salmonella sp. S146_54837]|nr:hypothetical protein [Salmonella sp. S146_54837]